MSIRYIVAAALLEGNALPPQFSDGKIADPAIVKLAQEMEVVQDPVLDKLYPARFSGWVAAEVDGEWVRADVADPTGSTGAPVDARGLRDKFAGINPQLPVEKIAEAAHNFEKVSLTDLLGLLNAEQRVAETA
jgi:2-methylcitrate dehydratase PrpD